MYRILLPVLYGRKEMPKIMVQSADFGGSSGWMFTFSDKMIKEIELWWFIC